MRTNSFHKGLISYKALFKDMPEIGRQIEDVFLDGMRGGQPDAAVSAHFAAIAEKAVHIHIGRASDESVNAYGRFMIEEIEELNQKNPDTCYRFIFPKAMNLPGLPNPRLAPAREKCFVEILGRIVRSAIHTPQAPPDENRSAALMDLVRRSLLEEFGVNLGLVETVPMNRAGRKMVCQITAALYGHILELDNEDSSLLIRKLLSYPTTAH